MSLLRIADSGRCRQGRPAPRMYRGAVRPSGTVVQLSGGDRVARDLTKGPD